MEKTITGANYHEEVEESKLPVLIDFYADWCGPCQMMAPIVERMSDVYEGRLSVGKCNVDQEEDLASKFGVMSIPMIIIVKDEKVIMKTVGGMSEADLKAKIDAAIG